LIGQWTLDRTATWAGTKKKERKKKPGRRKEKKRKKRCAVETQGAKPPL
jgi:hypothetical protein